jgi:hypothetical protein
MTKGLTVAVALLVSIDIVCAQAPPAATETTPAPLAPDLTPTAPPAPATIAQPTPAHRNVFSRMLHPFGSGPKPESTTTIKDPKLRGLSLAMEVAPQPAKLSEVRQLDVKATITNHGKKAVELSFGTDQRIEIYLKNTGDVVLTKWSENHAINNQAGTVLINPGEHIEYNEKISTRELARDKVYVAEVFFPQYPELRTQQKFLTAP